MTTPSRDFGVQSYCFREFDNRQIAGMVRSLGLDKIEMCAVHADFNNLPAWREVAAIYSDEGISIPSIGVQTFTGAASERDWFECAAAAGARHISAHFHVESYLAAIPQVVKWTQEFGIRVGIHCHGGYMFGGSPDVLRHLLALGTPGIGLCIDTAWAMQIGPNQGDPVKWAQEFAGQITGVHFKDFTFGPNGQWKDVIVGTGNLDLAGFVSALDAGGFDGVAVIEYEGDAHDPLPALRQCVESMRAATA